MLAVVRCCLLLLCIVGCWGVLLLFALDYFLFPLLMISYDCGLSLCVGAAVCCYLLFLMLMMVDRCRLLFFAVVAVNCSMLLIIVPCCCCG